MVLGSEEDAKEIAEEIALYTVRPGDFHQLLMDAARFGAKLKNDGYHFQEDLKKPIRVAITGAAGNIGYSLIPRIASGEVFGKTQPVILHLLELPNAIKNLEGVAMEIQDSAFNLVQGIVCTSDLAEGFKDVDYCFLIGATPRGKGMERKDLLLQNAQIFTEQGKALNQYAKSTCLTVVVGNPANTNALIASSHATNIPPENFTAMTRLDQNRAIGIFSNYSKIHQDSIRKVVIWGNHSNTQVPDLSFVSRLEDSIYIRTQTKPIEGIDQNWIDEVFVPEVQNRGAAIIKVKGTSSAFSAADAAIKHMRDWVFGSPDWVSMAVPSDGSYGVQPGLYCSFPVKCLGQGKYEIIQDLTLSDKVKNNLLASVKELEEEKSGIVSQLGPRTDFVSTRPIKQEKQEQKEEEKKPKVLFKPTTDKGRFYFFKNHLIHFFIQKKLELETQQKSTEEIKETLTKMIKEKVENSKLIKRLQIQKKISLQRIKKILRKKNLFKKKKVQATKQSKQKPVEATKQSKQKPVQPTKQNKQKPVEETKQKPVEETTQKPVEVYKEPVETKQEPVEETKQNSVEETKQNSVEETKQNSVEETKQKPVEENKQNSVEETKQKPVEETKQTNQKPYQGRQKRPRYQIKDNEKK